MLDNLISFGRAVTPQFLLPLGRKVADRLIAAAIKRKIRKGYQEILNYYEGKTVTAEQQEVLDYLRKHGFDMFPYEYLHEKKPSDTEVLFDKEKGMPYLLLAGKRLYYPEDATRANIQQIFYIDQLLSQHPQSPHRYLADGLTVEADDIVVDCGAADGNFSLDVVDTVKRIYLFEPSERWQKPLNATFAPWKDKVVIVKKFVSDKTDHDSINLDDYFAGKSEAPTFIKMDLEGYEGKALRSAEKLLRAKNGIRKAAVCTYHRQDDEQNLGAFLRECGFKATPSKGYMLFAYDDDQKPPYFRRGVIRATKGK